MTESTYESIKRVAGSLFATQGYEATTLNDIAASVGIKKPSLYVYFKSKEDLFVKVFADLVNEYQAFMNGLIESVAKMETEKKLYAIFEQYILFFISDHEKSMLWNRVLLFPPVSLKENIFLALMEIEKVFSEKLAAIISEGVDKGCIREASIKEIDLSFRCYREGVLMAYLLNPTMDKDLIPSLWDSYWQGLNKKLGKGIQHENNRQI